MSEYKRERESDRERRGKRKERKERRKEGERKRETEESTRGRGGIIDADMCSSLGGSNP